jgi:hypothetical protein
MRNITVLIVLVVTPLLSYSVLLVPILALFAWMLAITR